MVECVVKNQIKINKNSFHDEIIQHKLSSLTTEKGHLSKSQKENRGPGKESRGNRVTYSTHYNLLDPQF